MGKCQYCEQSSVVQVTEINHGAAQEVLLCETHVGEHLGGDFIGGVVSPFSFSELDTRAADRLVRVIHEAGLDEKKRPSIWTSDSTVPVFLELLGDEEPHLRWLGAGWLGASAGSAIPSLEQAVHDENEHVRNAAEKAVENIKGTRGGD